MAEAESEPRAVLWELRLTTALPMPPLAVGALTSATLIAAILVFHWVFGFSVRNPDAIYGLHDAPRFAIFWALLLGYELGGFGYAALGVARDLQGLGVVEARPPSDVLARDVKRSRYAGGAGIVVGFAALEAIQRSVGSDVSALGLVATFSFLPGTALLAATCWVTGRVVYFAVQRGPYQGAGLTEDPVDLLNLRPFQVLGRVSLRHAFLAIIGISLATLWIFVPGFAATFVAFTAVSLVIPTLIFVTPVRGVRRRIREAKHAELAALEPELRRVRDAAIDGDKAVEGRLADLLAYRAYVEAVREWPFDTSTVTRFGLYLLIPLASWFGSAFVERLVNAVLD